MNLRLSIIIAISLIAINGINGQVDSIFLSNGDFIIGEVKSLDQGVLKFSTDYDDSDFKIKWQEVVRIKSDRTFVINLSEGDYFICNGMKSYETGFVSLKPIDDSLAITIPMIDIVFIDPVEGNMKGHLDLMIDLGYTITKSEGRHQFNGSSRADYITEKWSGAMNVSSIMTRQDSTENTNRSNAELSFRYHLPANWFIMQTSDFLRNDELNLRLRSNIRAGLGKYLAKTNKLYLGLAFGAAWNNDKYLDTSIDNKNSAEGFSGMEFRFFDIGDFSLFTRSVYFLGITEEGRHRIDSKLDIKYELPRDFYLKLGFTFDYDNKPVGDASKFDYVLQTSFGWEL